VWVHRRARPDLPRFTSIRPQLGKHKDKVIDELFASRRAPPMPGRSGISAPRRLLDEEAHALHAPVALQSPSLARQSGDDHAASHIPNNQLDTVWLSE
jgi:hypothetical protein